MHAFDYLCPLTLADAISHLNAQNGASRLLAGGTDLIDQMRNGRHTPEVVIDIKRVPELNVLYCDADGLHLGAAVPCCRIYETPDIKDRYTALVDSCHIIGGIQIQSRASVGGNICNSGPAADSTPSLIALGAICEIAGPHGSREVPAEAFCTGPGTNVLQRGELLVKFRIPAPAAHSGSHYRRVIPRNEMDIAVVGAAAHVTLDEPGGKFVAARVALGAVAPTPLLAESVSEYLIGKPVSDVVVKAAADMARDAIAPITDMRGTKEYRTHVTGVLVERVLHAAIARAQGRVETYRPGN